MRQPERASSRQHVRQIPLRGGLGEGLSGIEQPLVQRQAHLRRTLAGNRLSRGLLSTVSDGRVSPRRLLQLYALEAHLQLAETQTLLGKVLEEKARGRV